MAQNIKKKKKNHEVHSTGLEFPIPGKLTAAHRENSATITVTSSESILLWLALEKILKTWFCVIIFNILYHLSSLVAIILLQDRIFALRASATDLKFMTWPSAEEGSSKTGINHSREARARLPDVPQALSRHWSPRNIPFGPSLLDSSVSQNFLPGKSCCKLKIIDAFKEFIKDESTAVNTSLDKVLKMLKGPAGLNQSALATELWSEHYASLVKDTERPKARGH